MPETKPESNARGMARTAAKLRKGKTAGKLLSCLVDWFLILLYNDMKISAEI
ncbi:hypothetical protein GT20_3338 [Parageobacillus thermoglucosidasius TNO-09.020]|nr:hypothetical protein GT20_3338 [Parageobacillus thermoglucosidasius TNO-09.020]